MSFFKKKCCEKRRPRFTLTQVHTSANDELAPKKTRSVQTNLKISKHFELKFLNTNHSRVWISIRMYHNWILPLFYESSNSFRIVPDYFDHVLGSPHAPPSPSLLQPTRWVHGGQFLIQPTWREQKNETSFPRVGDLIYSLWHFPLPDVPNSINMHDYRRKSIGPEVHPMNGNEAEVRTAMDRNSRDRGPYI